MDRLDELESQSIYIIREAHYHYKNLAVLWSIGKDSTTLVWLCRKAFFGKIPFPALHIDTSYKFPKMYKFRDEYSKIWGMNLFVSRNEEAIAAGMMTAVDMDRGIRDLYRTAAVDGVFCYTFFKAVAVKS